MENVESFAFGWPQELIDQMYLDEDTLATQSNGEGEEDENKVIHRAATALF
jgi:protein PhnA